MLLFIKLWLMKMNKFKMLFFYLILFAVFDVQAKYVRKLKEPDFFIPEQDRMHKPEKLPEINFLANGFKSMPVFTKIPDYKLKYNQYLVDMAVFAENKKLPENKDLNDDLAEMNDGKIFEVNSNIDNKILTKEQMLFYSLVEKIIQN